MLRSIGTGESVESVQTRRRKGRLRWEGFAETEREFIFHIATTLE